MPNGNGNGNGQRPWQVGQQPWFPPVGGAQGVGVPDVLNEKLVGDALGTKGFVTGSGREGDPQVYHPGQPSAAQGMVAQTNAAWADWARRQGEANREKNRLNAMMKMMRMFS
jgi:hypothetical protein